MKRKDSIWDSVWEIIVILFFVIGLMTTSIVIISGVVDWHDSFWVERTVAVKNLDDYKSHERTVMQENYDSYGCICWEGETIND